MDVAGKTVWITGASSGIGAALATACARAGAKLVLSGRRADALAEVAGRCQAQTLVLPFETTDLDALPGIVAQAETWSGGIDILVNNAGASSQVRNIRWIGDQDWNDTIEVNLNAVYVLVQAVLPAMLEAGGGTIVTVSSLAAVRPGLLGGAPYGAAKAAVQNLMKFLYATFRNDGIRVTTILPGEVNTPIMDTRVRPPSSDERAAMVDPDDVARAILLCCSLPARATIEELVISPSHARDQGPDTEISRWMGAPADFLKNMNQAS